MINTNEETIILVDRNDLKIGEEEKLKCHQGDGLLHRAFTVFLVNDKKEVLITKRSATKPLWPLFWETSCSSHQSAPNEPTVAAAEKRLQYELGIKINNLEIVDKFHYKAHFNQDLTEHEMCWLVVGKYNGEIIPNAEEVAIFKWQSVNDLEADMGQNQKVYVPWLKPAFDMLAKSSIIKP